MIHSTSPSGSSAAASAASLNPAKPAASSLVPGPDRLSLNQAGSLNAALADQPETRPEVVERGRALAADPDYPSAAILQKVAQMIVASPDLSEDQS
jgi:hypothetical protein